MDSEHGSGTRSANAHAEVIGKDEFHWIRTVVKAAAGIHLTRERAPMVNARLAKRIRATGSADLGSYITHVQQDATCVELWAMIDSLTVNRTCFYREADHFPAYLACLRELLRHHETVTVWSAGCATGEETFTLAMLAHALLPDAAQRVRLLGTDISAGALRTARAGIYSAAAVAPLPPLLRAQMEPAPDSPGRFRVKKPIRKMISFARHNLVGVWQMRGPMHIIFCRNVLIYFDRPTQRRVTDSFHDLLAPGGYLFLGHTETLSPDSPFRYLQPSTYRKLSVPL